MTPRGLRFFAIATFLFAGMSFVAGNARAQNDSASSSQNPSQPAASPAPADQTPSKKVWTNDDGRFHSGPAASTPAVSAKPNKPRANNNGKNGNWYRSQITKLQGQIPPLDEKIAQLQAALNGQTTNTPRPYGWSKPEDWHTQLAQYQKQREDIDAKISALEDEARHNGVPESEIP
jgi:hypothetical protein